MSAPSRWPRLLDRQDAAEYCGVSVNHFLTHCPVASVQLGARRLWDRAAIDGWLDGLGAGHDTLTAEEWLERA
jgi:hypothetical protein